MVLSGVAQGASYFLSFQPFSYPPPFLFCRCCYLCLFRSEGRSLGWCRHSVQAGGASAPLACVCLGMGPRRQRLLLPPPTPSSPRMTFMAHLVSDWSPLEGYGTWYPAFPYLDLHIPLMWYEGQDSLDASQGEREGLNPRPDACLRTSLMGPTLSLSALHLVLS